MKKTLATIFSTLFILFSLAGCGVHDQVNYESYEGHPRIVTLQIVGFNDFHGNTYYKLISVHSFGIITVNGFFGDFKGDIYDGYWSSYMVFDQ